MTNYQNKEFLKKAVEISRENIENGGGPFGAVIVKDGEVIASSGNSVTRDNDPTAHAEVNAIRLAAKKLNNFDLSGCEIYSSCEPCPMCLAAIYWARIDKIYFANSRKEAGDIGFDDSFLYNEIPKSIELRKIPTVHLPLEEAKEVFRLWDDLDEKIDY